MIVMDSVGVLLVSAESKGKDNLAGGLDPISTVARIIFYSGDGGSFVHGHGLLGWVALSPVLVTDFFTTKYATRFSRRIKGASSSD